MRDIRWGWDVRWVRGVVWASALAASGCNLIGPIESSEPQWSIQEDLGSALPGADMRAEPPGPDLGDAQEPDMRSPPAEEGDMRSPLAGAPALPCTPDVQFGSMAHEGVEIDETGVGLWVPAGASGGRAMLSVNLEEPIYFEVHVVTAPISLEVGGTSIPVVTDDPLGQGLYACALTPRSVVCYEEALAQLPAALERGDVVGVALDKGRGLFAFSINGDWIDGPPPADGFRVNEGASIPSLYPGARLGAGDAAVFNFTGPFEHGRPPGYAPLADCISN